jgi:FkbM family methyltransferase
MLDDIPWTRLKLGLARAGYRVLRPFVGNAPRVIERDGIRYCVDLSEGIDFALFLTGHFQSHVANPGLFALPRDAVVFDVGANVGAMALAFAKQAPQGRVFAFEPTHDGFARLARNLALNPELAARIETVQTFVAATSAREHGLVACASWKLDDSGGPKHPVHGGSRSAADAIPSVSLDDFCRERALARLDLIKIDTDGNELDVIAGARETLSRFHPAVVFEVGAYLLEERGTRAEAFLDLLEPLGYRLFEARSGRAVTRGNIARVVPRRATTDLLALHGA